MRTYNNQQIETEKVYYAGTDKLQEGDALCFDIAAAGADGQNTNLGVAVLKPATARLAAFAGFCAASSAGVTGPAYIEIVVPAKNKGKFIRANVKANATAYVTKLGPADASYALAAVPFDPTSAATSDASTAKQVALATSTADTSGAAAVKTVKFL